MYNFLVRPVIMTQYNGFVQVLAKIIINKNLFNKVTSICFHFVNKAILTVNRFNTQTMSNRTETCLSCLTFQNHAFICLWEFVIN